MQQAITAKDISRGQRHPDTVIMQTAVHANRTTLAELDTAYRLLIVIHDQIEASYKGYEINPNTGVRTSDPEWTKHYNSVKEHIGMLEAKILNFTTDMVSN